MKPLEDLAREAGLDLHPGWVSTEPGRSNLARFRSLCRAEDMEEAARLCEAVGRLYVEQGGDESGSGKPSRAIKNCAAAIREAAKEK